MSLVTLNLNIHLIKIVKMKRIATLAAAAMLTVAAHAQLSLGGSLGFGSSKAKGGHASNALTINPEINYSFNNTWSLGASVDFYSDLDDYSSIGVTPYARATFARVGNVSFFADGTLGFGSASYGDNSQTYWSIGVRPGFAVKLSPKVSIFANTHLLKYQAAGDNSDTNFSLNGDARVGVLFHL